MFTDSQNSLKKRTVSLTFSQGERMFKTLV